MHRSPARAGGGVTPLASASGDGYTLLEDAPLEGRNTFRVPARAALLVDVRRPAALAELFAYPLLRTQPLLVLGEGSNILFTRDWPGVVLSIAVRGIEVVEDDGEQARVRVAAGEHWNDFVHWSLGHGFSGLENLVLIPGTVGAAPIQNIGAYGVEVREFIRRVEAWDRHAGAPVILDNAACRFGYRDSVFKRERDRYVVTAVEFGLPRRREPRIDYAGVAEELAQLGAQSPTPAAVAEAIARIRTRKLPDPAVLGNAGSFFKNPVVAASVAASLVAAHPDLPHWPAEAGQVKLPAAWLIERAGLRGASEGDAAIAPGHALVLVNRGRATGAQVGALARRVQDAVAAHFGIALEAEPLVV
jgi:UDP-N-acetylmuramate dehydrogenase